MKTAPRILIAARADGLTHIGAVEDPRARVQLLQSHGVNIEATWWTERSPHAVEVAGALRRQFQAAALEPGSPWFATEFQDVLEALDAFDLATGERVSRGRVAVGSPVRVAGAGVGTVRGFTACGRARVSIERYAHAALEVLAPPSLVELLA